MEKLAFTLKVTLPEAGMLTLKPLKVAVDPEKVAEPRGLPLFNRSIPLIPVGLPVPESDTVRLVMFTVVFPVLVKTTSSTGTLEAPGNWVELAGAPAPVETCTVAGVAVGVLDAVGVAVATAIVIVAAL